jgi:hypothetical protein
MRTVNECELLTPQLMLSWPSGVAESAERQLRLLLEPPCVWHSESGIVFAYLEGSYVRPYIRLTYMIRRIVCSIPIPATFLFTK